jgi:hypothetical protein
MHRIGTYFGLGSLMGGALVMVGCGSAPVEGGGPVPSPGPNLERCEIGCPSTGSSLATDLSIALRHAVDAGALYVGDSGGRLFRVCKKNRQRAELANLPGSVVFCVTLDADTAYFGSVRHGQELGSGGGVWSVPLLGGQALNLVTSIDWVTDIAVDATHIYWISQGSRSDGLAPWRPDGRLARVPKGGGAVEVLAQGLAGPYSLELDATHVYFTIAGGTDPPPTAGFGIRRVPKAGGAVEVVERERAATYLALDQDFVYFTETAETGGVRRVPKLGGPIDRTYASGLRFPLDLAVSGGRLYYLVLNGDVGALQSVGVDGSAPVQIAVGLDAPGYLVIDDCAVYVTTRRTVEVLPRN